MQCLYMISQSVVVIAAKMMNYFCKKGLHNGSSLFVSESLGTRCTSNCVRLQADGRRSGEVCASTL